MTTKCCSKCNLVKSAKDFHKDVTKKDGLQSFCKLCGNQVITHYRRTHKGAVKAVSKRYRKSPSYTQLKGSPAHIASYRQSNWKRSGILNAKGGFFRMEDYNLAFELQQGKCKVCHRHQSELSQTLCVDHNHTTKQFRGLLCRFCNSVIVNYLENYSELVASAQNYLTLDS